MRICFRPTPLDLKTSCPHPNSCPTGPAQYGMLGPSDLYKAQRLPRPPSHVSAGTIASALRSPGCMYCVTGWPYSVMAVYGVPPVSLRLSILGELSVHSGQLEAPL